jgi:cytochrome c-type biogenesis protein
LPSADSVSYAVAFSAGLLSFLSPCVLPLIPSYIGFLTGMSLDQIEARRGTALLHGLWFVAGFSLVFVLLGAAASAVGNLLREHQVWLGRIGGVLIILFGLYLVGALRPAFLMRERRIQLGRKRWWGSRSAPPGRPVSGRSWAPSSPSPPRARGSVPGWRCSGYTRSASPSRSW